MGNDFFDIIRKIRQDQSYKDLNKISYGNFDKDIFLKTMDVSKELSDIKNLLDSKISSNHTRSGYDFFMDRLDKAAQDLLGESVGPLIEFPQIDTPYQLTINFLKIKGVLNKKYGDPVKVNDLLDDFVVRFQSYLQKEGICAGIEIVKDEKTGYKFLNFDITDKYIKEILEIIIGIIEGKYSVGDVSGRKLLIDYSSPNVAKQMTVGHLRSTLIGEVIKNLYVKKGNSIVLGFNHLGDWGEQFGKLFYVLLNVSDDEISGFETTFLQNQNKALFDIYMKFKKMDGSQTPEAEYAVKALATRLNDGDPDLLTLWTIIRNISINDFQKIYTRLGISFDSWLGEAFYEVMLDETINDLDAKGLIVKDSEGEKLYFKKIGSNQSILLSKDDFEKGDHDPQDLFQRVLRNSAGVANYLTRDIAALRFRRLSVGVDEVIYLTGTEQVSHFEALKEVAQKAGYIGDDNFLHIYFGLYLQGGKKMSSRAGNVDKLSDVFDQVDEVLHDDVLSDAAILVNDLKQQIHKGVEFDVTNMTRSEGDTGVYLIYSAVRWKKILFDRSYEFDLNHIDSNHLSEGYSKLLGDLFKYRDIIRDGIEQKKLHSIISYAFDLAHRMNNLYMVGERISQIDDLSKKNAILAVMYIGYKILEDIFGLLNIQLPEKI